MIIAGGPGLAMGSWLHDLFEISFMGTAYEVFGPLNVMFAITGLIIMFLGIILLVISLRGGMVSEEDIKDAKAEG